MSVTFFNTVAKRIFRSFYEDPQPWSMHRRFNGPDPYNPQNSIDGLAVFTPQLNGSLAGTLLYIEMGPAADLSPKFPGNNTVPWTGRYTVVLSQPEEIDDRAWSVVVCALDSGSGNSSESEDFWDIHNLSNLGPRPTAEHYAHLQSGGTWVFNFAGDILDDNTRTTRLVLVRGQCITAQAVYRARFAFRIIDEDDHAQNGQVLKWASRVVSISPGFMLDIVTEYVRGEGSHLAWSDVPHRPSESYKQVDEAQEEADMIWLAGITEGIWP